MNEFESTIIAQEDCGWEFPQEKEFSFQKVMYFLTETSDEFSIWSETFIDDIINFIKQDPLLDEVFDDEDQTRFSLGFPSESLAELVAAAELFNISIIIHELDMNFTEICRTKIGNYEEKISIAYRNEKYGRSLSDQNE